MSRAGWRLLRELLRPRRAALLGMALWTLPEALPAALSGRLIAQALDGGFLAGRPLVGLGWLLVFGAVAAIGAFGSRQVYPHLAEVIEPLRDDLTRRVVLAALDEPAGRAGGPDTAAVARLVRQIETVRECLAGQLLIVRHFVVTLLFVLLGAASLDPLLLPLIALPLALALTVFALLLPRMAARQREVLRAEEELARLAADTFGALRDVVACGAVRRADGDLSAAVDAQSAARNRVAALAALRRTTVAAGVHLPAVLILLGAPGLVREHGLSPGAVVGALGYLTISLEPALRTLVQGLSGSGLRLAVAADRLARRTVPPPSTPPLPSPSSPAPASPPLTLSDLTFRYHPDAAPVLDGLSLLVRPGEHLAVVGPSGVGKSTLADLLAGLATPERGTVHLPGTTPRHRVLIPQEAYVFTGTLRANLALLAPPGTPDAQLLDAARRFGLDDLLDLTGGLDRTLHPAELSAGESQLIALTRAYLAPAPLAILDEATSELDPAAEARAELAFRRRPGTTLLVVAHRISSAERADRVLLLTPDGPHLGTHPTLLTSSPTYRALHTHWTAHPPPHNDPMPPKRRPHPPTLAELTADLPPPGTHHGPGIPSPAGRPEFVDDRGRRWRKVRGPLDPRLTKRLLTGADEVIIGRSAGFDLHHLTPTDRPTTWPAIKRLLNSTTERPSYHPYEFTSADGRTLLYIEESC